MPRHPRFAILLFNPRGGEAVSILRRRSLVAARVTARKLLASHRQQTTRALWHWDKRCLWTADILGAGGRYESHEAERVLVPSVGEMGWAP